MSRNRFSRLGRRSALGLLVLTLSATVASATSTSLFSQIFGGARNTHSVYVGRYDNYVIVRGNGSTDLDCWLYDADGDLVSRDTDETDVCVLSAPGIGMHRVAIRNLGGQSNFYSIRKEN